MLIEEKSNLRKEKSTLPIRIYLFHLGYILDIISF